MTQQVRISQPLFGDNRFDLQPYNIFEQSKGHVRRLSTTGVVAFLLSARSIASASTETITKCSDSITILRSAITGKEIFLIGTAHISEESAELVRNVIKKVKPDVVMIELDPKRLGKLPQGQTLSQLGFDVPASAAISTSTASQELPEKSSALGYLVKQFGVLVQGIGAIKNMLYLYWIRNGTYINFFFHLFICYGYTAGAAVGQALKAFYKNVEKLGFTAGGEFRAAIDEGLSAGSRILLGDRDIDVTLDRLARALSATDPTQ